jgi:hypothetical protein
VRRNEFTRGAAVAVFCLEMRQALEVLEKGVRAATEKGDHEAKNMLGFISMALSGYTEARDSQWRQTVQVRLGDGVSDPYVRAMFAFLTAGEADGTHAGVLDEPGTLPPVSRRLIGLDYGYSTR